MSALSDFFTVAHQKSITSGSNCLAGCIFNAVVADHCAHLQVVRKKHPREAQLLAKCLLQDDGTERRGGPTRVETGVANVRCHHPGELRRRACPEGEKLNLIESLRRMLHRREFEMAV